MATKSTPKFNASLSKMAVVKMPKKTTSPTKAHLGKPRTLSSVKTGSTPAKAVVKKGAGNGRVEGKNAPWGRSTRANVC